MENLSKLRLEPPAQWEAERLTRWLFEWQILQSADTPGTTPDCPTELITGNLVAEFDSNIAVGQIRLMRPHTENEPVFIAVIRIEDSGEIVCVPFGPLSEPATPDELLSGRTTPALRVLCLWNSRTLSPHLLNHSWVADELPQAELARLRQALDAWEATGRVPAELAQEAGPPLVHPEDPRRLYRTRERRRIDHAVVREHDNQDAGRVIRYDIYPADRKLPKAAEDHDSYDA
jgi:hypothetical protein